MWWLICYLFGHRFILKGYGYDTLHGYEQDEWVECERCGEFDDEDI